MKVYSLSGPSGTGKSYHAIGFSKKYNIESIIDDGLFIYKNMVVEGTSAKKAETKVGAIKAAVFFDDEKTEAMKKAIAEKNPENILILGTSDKMIDKIVTRLELVADGPSEDNLSNIVRVHIEDITTPEERKRAAYQRQRLGKHVVPAPTMQLKKNFAGYFIDPMRLFRGREVGAALERTVVRPPFSYNGDYIVEERVIDDIVRCIAKKTPIVNMVLHIGHISRPDSYGLYVTIRINRGYPIWESLTKFQNEINEMIETMTAFNVTKVDIDVRGIDDGI